MEIYLGKTSNNEPVLKNIRGLPVLFQVYNHKKQWDDYLDSLLLMNPHIRDAKEWELFRIVSRYG